jgi:hypothetical protein
VKEECKPLKVLVHSVHKLALIRDAPAVMIPTSLIVSHAFQIMHK